MVYRQTESVRLTHLPTGMTVKVDPAWFGRHTGRHKVAAWLRFKLATACARQLLLARLCRPDEAPRPVRTYDLHPPWGIPPRIREGDRVLVSGADEVRAFLNGEW